ncbi:hypothetical protein QT711_05920 [Sporosarcina saromensis]|uniref:ABC-2 family transporter protein n=1 Tax=Sporosarcina saromensis TaxID=359365 RepID=A0ABU4G6V8_9BACL|nr:hypothetical protein [Sporosarcina saromensis]MDW0112714.1 hypothetical protein [Sporosarcina saromensis]
MRKEKLQIPSLEEQVVQMEIDKIVATGITPKVTFLTYLKSMIQQVGMRHIFSDRLELGFLITVVAALLAMLIISPFQGQIQDIYSYIFLLSPILFMVLSVSTYLRKTQNNTYEVEMACKYNVYQIIACRMLLFSLLSVVLNTIAIAAVAMQFEGIHFLRAFLLSLTSLFVFSTLLLFALMRRRTSVIVIMTVIGWTFGNLLLQTVNVQVYNDFLLKLNTVVNAIVLLGMVFIYIRCVKKLIQFKQMEGVF